VALFHRSVACTPNKFGLALHRELDSFYSCASFYPVPESRVHGFTAFEKSKLGESIHEFCEKAWRQIPMSAEVEEEEDYEEGEDFGEEGD
jgi:hypothetical protein